MPEDDLLSLLRAQWHLVPTGIGRFPGALLSDAWEFAAGDDRYLARLTTTGGCRQPVEAALAAADRLRERGIAVGAPVRTLRGSLTAALRDGWVAVLRRPPGRPLAGADPVDQQWWGDRLGAVHRALQHFRHPGLRPWNLLDPEAEHLDAEPWLRDAVTGAVTATTRLTVTDRLTYGVLHGDPAPQGFVVDPDTGRAGLLDCGGGGTGPLVHDVAAAVLYAGGVSASAELLDGYLAAGPVHRDELAAALPVLMRFHWALRADRSARRLAAPGLAGADDAGRELHRARVALDATPG